MCDTRPPAGNETPLAKLIAQGRATPPKGDLLELDPPAGKSSTAASDAVIADRDDRL